MIQNEWKKGTSVTFIDQIANEIHDC